MLLRLYEVLNESGSHNRRSQVHGRVCQTVYDIDREVVPLSSDLEPTCKELC
jgi:hypothetical protein